MTKIIKNWTQINPAAGCVVPLSLYMLNESTHYPP